MRTLYIHPKTKIVSTAFVYGSTPYEADPETTKNILDGTHEIDHTKTKKHKKITTKKRAIKKLKTADKMLSKRVQKLEAQVAKLHAMIQK